MQTLLQDIRYSVRKLLKSPGFTAVAVLTLALGIGANSAIFSVVNGVLLQSLPYEAPDRLVRIYTEYPDGGLYTLSPPDFMSVRAEAGSLSDVVAYAGSNVTLTGTGDPKEVAGLAVSDGFFETLGVRPALGRGFRQEEHQAGRGGVVVLGNGFWQRDLGGAPDVLGRTITLSGEAHEVVGVLPAGVDFPGDAELFAPLPYDETFSATTAQGRRGEYLAVLARMAPGVDFEQTAAEVRAISERLREAFPQTNQNQRLAARPLHDVVVGEARTPLLVLLGAVGLVLLIACANVANLLLARASVRESELAVRTALGAGRGRLIRQLLTESLVLGVLGGAVGLLLAWWGTQALLAAQPVDIPRLHAVDVDGTVVAFTLLVAVLTGVIFGLVPALQTTRGDVAAALKEGGRGALAGRGGQRLRAGLVVAEMALAVVLLVGAGLLIRSFAELTAVDPGFRSEQAMAFKVSLPQSVYDEPPARHVFFSRLEEEVEALPGVMVAGATSGLPLQGSGAILSFRVDGQEPPAPGEVQDIHVKLATPDYFRAMGVPVVRGRLFNATDRQDAPNVVVVNEAAARRWFPSGEAVGERITFGGTLWREVVGVVSDLRQFGPAEPAQPELFIPHAQANGGTTMQVVVRSAGDPLALTGAIRGIVQGLDPNLPVEQFTTLDQVVAESVAQPRFYTTLLAIFAAVALALAATGIFGVMSYTVAQRTREIGIRIALGAPAGGVRSVVVGRAMLLVLGGLGIGLLGAFALTRVLQSQLYGVSPTDPVTFAVVALTLAGAAFVASWLPARRATRVDPMTALRTE